MYDYNLFVDIGVRCSVFGVHLYRYLFEQKHVPLFISRTHHFSCILHDAGFQNVKNHMILIRFDQLD